MEILEGYKKLEGEIGFDILISDLTSKMILSTYGGDLTGGFAGYDFLKLDDSSEVGVMGVCASSGTIILCGAKKRWGSINSQFSIHNPWTNITGDADLLGKTAEDLTKAQDRLVAIYVASLIIDEQEIRSLMKENKFIDATEAKRIGLIHEIKTDDFAPLEGENAKAMFYNLKRETMAITKEELNIELEKNTISILDRIKNLLPGRIKNIVLKDSVGVELNFGVDTKDEIVDGTSVAADGTPANGTYVLDVEQITVTAENGLVTLVEPIIADETAALKEEIENLKAQLSEGETAKAESEETIVNLTKGLEEVNAQMGKYKAQFTKSINNLAIPGEVVPPGESEKRSAFKAN